MMSFFLLTKIATKPLKQKKTAENDRTVGETAVRTETLYANKLY